MSSSPAFASTPKGAQVQIATANTARDGTGTLGTLLTLGANGGRIERIFVQAAGTVTAGVVRLFISYDGGTTKRLFSENLITATTPSTTVAAFNVTLTLGLVLPASAIVYASTHNAETFNVFAEYGEF